MTTHALWARYVNIQPRSFHYTTDRENTGEEKIPGWLSPLCKFDWLPSAITLWYCQNNKQTHTYTGCCHHWPCSTNWYNIHLTDFQIMFIFPIISQHVNYWSRVWPLSDIVGLGLQLYLDWLIVKGMYSLSLLYNDWVSYNTISRNNRFEQWTRKQGEWCHTLWLLKVVCFQTHMVW